MSDAPDYDCDFYGDDFIRNPQPHYAAMRKLGAVVYLPRLGNYAVVQYSAVREALRNVGVYRSGEGVAGDDVERGAHGRLGAYATAIRTDLHGVVGISSRLC